MKDKYVVIYTDHGDTTDGLSRVLGTYDSEKTAQDELQKDCDQYLSNNPDAKIVDRSAIHTIAEASNYGCTWQILHLNL